jgi:non-ribosomal peptide synthetase component F
VFTLMTTPPVRLRLVRLGDEDHQLLLSFHHIAGDAWSVAVLQREVTALYAAYRDGRPSPLPELTLQYADYAVWQRASMTAAALEDQLEYWRQQLASAKPLVLPADGPGECGDTAAINRMLVIPADVTDALRALSRQKGATLFMTLLAAFKVLLARWTGADDLVVGSSSIVSRERAELEGLIGLFVNMLPIRTRLDGRPTFLELLDRVREAALGAYAHHEVPFDRLVQELGIAGQDARIPVIQAVFGLAEVPQAALVLPGISIETESEPALDPRFPLSIWITSETRTLNTRWTFNPRYFRRETIERLQREYLALLVSITSAPHARIEELEVTDERERQDHEADRRRREAGNAHKLRAAARVSRRVP